MSETAIISVFFWLAFVLLFLVTAGVIYLTFLEWQDRRRNKI
ncbi:hypothetical protein TUMEXPCC7403_14145 [Tumidithrix helvetica PCC 7403]